MAGKQIASLWDRMWPFALLCGLDSLVWLLLDRYPEINFTLTSDALACGTLAVLAFAAAAVSRSSTISLSQGLRAAFAGALVLAGPAAGTFFHASALDAGSLAIALALTPVVVAVAEGVTNNLELSHAALWPGLAMAAGLLLVLPPPALADWRSDATLVLAPVLTGLGCVLFRRSPAPALTAAAAGFVSAALLFGAGSAVEAVVQHSHLQISPAAAAIDAVLFLLTLTALGRIDASQFVARYALVPLMILVQGPLLLHSLVTWRSAGCAALLLAAAIQLLRSNRLAGVTS